MRRAASIMVLIAATALAACQPAATNVPAGQVGDRTQQPGESVVVGSLSTLGLTDLAGRRLHFIFNAYDPATNRLIPNGPSFVMVRGTCRVRGSAECDPALPLHQVVSVPPGHYVLTTTQVFGDTTVVQQQGNTTVLHYYVPVDVGFWSRNLQSNASLENTDTINIEVLPNEVLYFGQLSVDRLGEGAGQRYYTMVFDVERDDAAAKAALEAEGVNASAMVFRPPT